MSILQSIKPFWPLLFTFVLPRAINYYRVVKTAIRTRPPSRPLPQQTSHGLNVLFASICISIYLSLPLLGKIEDHNVFVVTQSHFSQPTEILFQRLALMRDHGILTPIDEELKSKLTTQSLRQLYLRFGPSTLLNCTFCHPNDAFTYLLYHLPTNILLPHLLHILALGVATSESVSGVEAHHWRRLSLIGAVILFSLDIWQAVTYTPVTAPMTPSPAGTFWLASTLRYLSFSFFDGLVAFLIYASATGRFLLFSAPSSADPTLAKRRTEELLTKMNLALQMTSNNLRAFSVVRNAVVRDSSLKAVDDEYWRTVVAIESDAATDESLFEDEEVQAALAKVYGTGKVDVQTMRREADAFVRNVTKGL
ncbi:hypothetical protein B0A52_08173 [Exophiala mesophila]|uniref:Uncharacterized protein n=1 Tax=Exophiala mesophila TaxID=212818 RepID=A0A438MXK9_EXOME|nr:hypothetical protein B0A52_08173 [Exophiala mesophila]